MNKKVVIIGGSGHGKVIADIILKSNDIMIGFLDDNIEIGKKIFLDYEIIGNLEDSLKLQADDNDLSFVIAIGNNYIRKEVFEKYQLNYYTAIHPNAVIGLDVTIGEGTVIMPNACVNPNSRIGKCNIINTSAVVEHENILEDFVHISPNATLCGNVKIGMLTHIGAGVTVKNNIEIGSESIIGAGAVVVKDIDEKGTYVGVPARKIKKEPTSSVGPWDRNRE